MKCRWPGRKNTYAMFFSLTAIPVNVWVRTLSPSARNTAKTYRKPKSRCLTAISRIFWKLCRNSYRHWKKSSDQAHHETEGGVEKSRKNGKTLTAMRSYHAMTAWQVTQPDVPASPICSWATSTPSSRWCTSAATRRKRPSWTIKLSSEEIADEIAAMSKKENDMW